MRKIYRKTNHSCQPPRHDRKEYSKPQVKYSVHLVINLKIIKQTVIKQKMEAVHVMLLSSMKESTAQQFTRMLGRVCTGVTRQQPHAYYLNFIHDTEAVEAYMNDPNNFASRTGTDGTVPHTTRKNYYNALQAYARIITPFNRDTYDFYKNKMMECNAMYKERSLEQRLEGEEADRWPTYEEFEQNVLMLDEMAKDDPDDLSLHLKWLLYNIYDELKDICVLRLDFVYSTRINITEGNCYQNGYLIFNDYKTHGTYGAHFIKLPDTLTQKIETSLRKWSRTHLFPKVVRKKIKDEAMSQPLASSFVKSAWVASFIPKTPTADDVRSTLTTRFFNTHLDILSRKKFANASMSSRDTMERFYYKVHE